MARKASLNILRLSLVCGLLFFSWHTPNFEAVQIANTFWKTAVEAELKAIEKAIQAFEQHTPKLSPEALALKKQTAAETFFDNQYQLLPEIYADLNFAPSFPRPWPNPKQYSYFYLWKKLKKLSGAKKNESDWLSTLLELQKLSTEKRYLDEWIPPLLENKSQLAQWVSLNKRFEQRDPELRNFLTPTRVEKTFILSKNGRQTIDLFTDLDLKSSTVIRFTREFEAALQLYWNQSNLFKSTAYTIQLQWKQVPANPLFAQKKISLNEHLAYFSGSLPATAWGITSGASSTFVQKTTLVLAPGQITPRILAHEIGHLLGFGDCYYKSIETSAFSGVQLLEWENPFYPDELMCNDHEGQVGNLRW